MCSWRPTLVLPPLLNVAVGRAHYHRASETSGVWAIYQAEHLLTSCSEGCECWFWDRSLNISASVVCLPESEALSTPPPHLSQASGYAPLDEDRRLAQLQLPFQSRGSKNYTWILITDSAELALFCGNNKWGCWRQSWDGVKKEKSFTIKGFLDNCYFQSLVFHTYRSAAVEIGDVLTLLSVSYSCHPATCLSPPDWLAASLGSS